MDSRTIAIIQARMSSTRLPGKSMMDICGRPLVEHVIRRVKKAGFVDDVVLAVPAEKGYGQLVDVAERQGVYCYIHHGEVNDLLDRYDVAAQWYQATCAVRVPADNPCVDPEEINRIIQLYKNAQQPTGQWLYTNLDQNVRCNGYPGGLGAEVYSSWFLHWLNFNVEDEGQREHPHRWAFNQGRVRTINAPPHLYAPDLRFDVNTRDDLNYVRKIYGNLGEDFTAQELIEFAR